MLFSFSTASNDDLLQGQNFMEPLSWQFFPSYIFHLILHPTKRQTLSRMVSTLNCIAILKSTRPLFATSSSALLSFNILIREKGYKVGCLNILHSQVWLGLCATPETPVLQWWTEERTLMSNCGVVKMTDGEIWGAVSASGQVTEEKERSN